MYLKRLEITNIRSIPKFVMKFNKKEAAGWHVVLGDNGAGKSSIIRSLALMFSGGTNVGAMRQNWSSWLRSGETAGSIQAHLSGHPKFDQTSNGEMSSNSVELKAVFSRETTAVGPEVVKIEFPDASRFAEQSVWSLAPGWFSASYGPFRRFSGGSSEWDSMFSVPDFRRAAAHFSAFGEDVALTAALPWLKQLHVKALEDGSSPTPTGLDAAIRDEVRDFVNNSDLLPHKAEIKEISSDRVLLVDGDGKEVPVEQMSDGYRSVLSMTFELLRQMFVAYGPQVTLDGIDTTNGNAVVRLPGVVAIDEVDAHLHPAWQALIGDWFTTRFPMVQFIVTTHSPIICRAAAKGSIWRLPAPGSDAKAGRLTGPDYDRLVYGNILEAMGTELFGARITRSEPASKKLDEIARLNKRLALGEITPAEEKNLTQLQSAMPMSAATIAA